MRATRAARRQLVGRVGRRADRSSCRSNPPSRVASRAGSGEGQTAPKHSSRACRTCRPSAPARAWTNPLARTPCSTGLGDVTPQSARRAAARPKPPAEVHRAESSAGRDPAPGGGQIASAAGRSGRRSHASARRPPRPVTDRAPTTSVRSRQGDRHAPRADRPLPRRRGHATTSCASSARPAAAGACSTSAPAANG